MLAYARQRFFPARLHISQIREGHGSRIQILRSVILTRADTFSSLNRMVFVCHVWASVFPSASSRNTTKNKFAIEEQMESKPDRRLPHDRAWTGRESTESPARKSWFRNRLYPAYKPIISFNPSRACVISRNEALPRRFPTRSAARVRI